MAFMTSGKTVSFPLGSYVDDVTASGGSVGAIEIKSAWRILDEQHAVRLADRTLAGEIVDQPQPNRTGLEQVLTWRREPLHRHGAGAPIP